MKNFFIISAAITLFTFWTFHQYYADDNKKESVSTLKSKVNTSRNITVVFLQDVSKSINKNGVELISSKVFDPYFNASTSSVDIFFGLIQSSSTKKLITVSLPAMPIRPSVPNLHDVGITEKRRLKEQYIIDIKAYAKDSSDWISQRVSRIAAFSHSVDSLLKPFKYRLSKQTDLARAISVADKVFNYPSQNTKGRYLIINGDGLDSFKEPVRKMKNNVQIILTNASGLTHTSLDPLFPMVLESPEEAIRFTIQ